ncbi:NUDIX hydrolase [Corynebacterium otitidis]|uniref:NUDIX hydrolase n=1 Tax=Corynebacterium otitidis TaxID=29321 RepID=UPI000627489A|nr:NUDIX hydrolase [Corynebacterium otitidis]KKO84417.1 NUDIX hydrolase [Corynebacterium otitidis]
MSDRPATRGFNGARLAATVVLVRDGSSGLEVFVQERVASMPSFPGFTVFPGGGVDARDFPADSSPRARLDADTTLWSGRPVNEAARLIGAPPAVTRALVFAAVRELFEETGTLLASHADGRPIGHAGAYGNLRGPLESHRMSLTRMLKDCGLKVDASLLHPWERWVGPSGADARFDTYSFLAQRPPGQEPDPATAEVLSAGWFPPRLILEGWREGLVRLVLPTWAQLDRLSRFDTVAEAVAEARRSDMTAHIGRVVGGPRFDEYFETQQTRKDRIGTWPIP